MDLATVVMDDGARIHVESHGPTRAPGVLVLHGALAVGRAMLSQAVALRDEWRVHLVDQRGHGASERLGTAAHPWSELNVGRLADDAERLMRALDAPRLVGASMGGIVAGTVAARRPRDVRALALLATAPAPSAARDEYFAAATPDAFPAGQRALWARWHGADGWRDLARNVFRAFGERAPADYPGERLRAYAGPALVLAGADDTLVPAQEAEAFRAWMPQADVRVVPGDHAFFAGAGRAATNDALREFLAPTRPSRSA